MPMRMTSATAGASKITVPSECTDSMHHKSIEVVRVNEASGEISKHRQRALAVCERASERA
eukprot:6208304-Pleurochrysis_carterae.AAC.2